MLGTTGRCGYVPACQLNGGSNPMSGEAYQFVEAELEQADRLLRLSTPLGEDVLLPEKSQIQEKINGLFEIEVVVKSKRLDVKPDEIVGKTADLSVEIAYGERRYWNGLVTGLMEGPPVSRGLRAYRLTIRPELWLLSQRSDCRIWLDKTTLQVAETLLSEHGIKAPVTGGVFAPPAPIHYSVQWNETDLAYLTRRLEQDGLFYWFEHEQGQHTLHIASHSYGYTEGQDTDVRLAAGSSDRNHITRFEKHFQFIPGKRAGGDWNFEMPSDPQGGKTSSLVSLPKNTEYELYEYPAKAMDGASNEAAVKLRMQAAESDHEQIEGESTVRTLAAGRKFKPYEVAHADDQFEEYVVTAIIHQMVDHSYETVQDGSLDYTNSFAALPARLPATPHRTTARPRIDGTQVAIIAGPSGEEIHPDEYGRVKVWFPWDRRAKRDGSDTCWMRVMQSWAGVGWGAQTIPRIGMEAMVTYIDGDPDRPVIAGLVPNKRQKVPYGLPAAKTKSGFKTQTHKGQGFNELSFDDDNGNEKIFVHAQKDLSRIIKDNESTTVEKGNRTTTLQQGDEHKTLDQGNRTVSVKTGDETKTIGQGNLSEKIALARKTEANTIGANAIAGKAGPGLITYTADDQITLKVGVSEITLTKNNIIIKHAGSVITLDALIIDQIAGNIHLNKDKGGA